jgi:hypothetical protein
MGTRIGSKGPEKRMPSPSLYIVKGESVLGTILSAKGYLSKKDIQRNSGEDRSFG